MKFIRKAAAIALVGAMIVTTVQTAAPDVVKAQVSYDTTVKIDTSLVPRDNNIEVIELEMNEDRGFARRHRVYRQLLFEPAMYRVNCSEEDFEYLKYYGGRLREDLEKNFDCQIHIHKGSAFFLNGEECRMGEIFPGNNVLSDILLLSLAEIQQHIQKEVWTRQTNETYVVSEVEFEKILSEVKQKYRSGFTKNYREMPQGEFVKIVEETMERWMFIQKRPLEHQVLILPACGKLKGRYPQNFTGGQESEQ